MEPEPHILQNDIIHQQLKPQLRVEALVSKGKKSLLICSLVQGGLLNMPWAPPEFSTTDPSQSSIFPLAVTLAISGAMVAPVRAHSCVNSLLGYLRQ